MIAILEPLIKSPQLPRHFAQLKDLLADERRRREEFYDAITEDGKWEFINGEVIMHSPAEFAHTEASQFLNRILSHYVDRHDLGVVTCEKTLVCLARNDYEPDLCYFNKAKAARFKPDQMKFPAPNFIVEVLSPSTEEHDRGVKFEDYSANGVREYWLVDSARHVVEQYMLRSGKYHRHATIKSGEVASTVIAGLRFPLRAIFDRAANLAAIQNL
jgi:Uma2 family endonuclease